MSVGGHQVYAVRATAGRYIACEWTSEIRRFAAGAGVDFRSVFLFFAMIGTGGSSSFVSQIVNSRTTAADEAYGNLASSLVPAHNFGWTAEGQALGWKEGLVRNERSDQWKRFFNNGDGLGHTWPAFSRTGDTDLPVSIDWKLRLVGFVTDPKGHLYRPWDTGVWTDLVGSFAVWNVRCTYLGTEYDIGNFFLEAAANARLSNTYPFGLDGEFFYTPDPLSSAPVEIVYSGFRVYDQQNGWWTELTDFQIRGDNDPADTEQGVNASGTAGKLTVHCGIGETNEVAIGKYVLLGLTYERGDSSAPLTMLNSSTTTTAGGQSYLGPLWGVPPLTYPFVQQEVDRGHYVMFPSNTVPAVCRFVARVSASYRLTGDFCRADDGPVGPGVTVSILKDTEVLFSGTINNQIVDGADIFNNAGIVHYDVTVSLLAGESVRFVATGTGNQAVDATGFRLTPPTFDRNVSVVPVSKSSPLYVAPDTIFVNLLDGSYGPVSRVRVHGLRHRVFFFDDADDAEIWNTIPNGTIAVAVGQSESDANADVMAFLNDSNQLEFDSTAGNNKTWVHVWERSSRPASATGTNAPPLSSGSGFVPTRTGMWTHDMTLAGDNLANGRIVGVGAFRHKVVPFEAIVDGDIWVGPAGIVSSAFQLLYKGSFVKTRIVARTLRSTTIQFSTTSQNMVHGWLHLWGKT